MRLFMFKDKIGPRGLSVLAFSLISAYLLSFVFEGQVLYSLSSYFDISSTAFIFAAIVAHFIGLFGCGFFVKDPRSAQRTMQIGIMISLAGSVCFFFALPVLWLLALMVCGLALGSAIAAWGFFLKIWTPPNERIKTCADVLILSNLLMILINFTALRISPWAGFGLAILALMLGGFFTTRLPIAEESPAQTSPPALSLSLKAPLLFLAFFVVIITINSGMMYQVFNPAFRHLTWLTSWYWAVPYIIALFVMRNMPVDIKRSPFLYVGLAMIMTSFIAFMILDRSAAGYLVVDTLMLGACGILDLFWWSILGEMLEFTDNPARIFGIGLSANVFGVLLGGSLGRIITSSNMDSANVAVIALTVVCITVAILPLVNRQLVLLLSNHTYLMAYSVMEEPQQDTIVNTARAIDPLTQREQEVLRLILSGKTNKAIAAELFISENTVKTHVKNIYYKHDVSSRAQLISTLLRNQASM